MSQAEKEERFVSVFQSDFATSVFVDVRSDSLRLPRRPRGRIDVPGPELPFV